MEAGNHECIVLIAVTVLLRFCLLYLLCNLESYELFLRLFLYVVPAYQTNIHKLQHHQHFHPGHWKCGDTQGHPGVWQDVGTHRVILVCDKMWGHTGSSWCVTRCGGTQGHPGVWQDVGTHRVILVCDKMWGHTGSSWCVTRCGDREVHPGVWQNSFEGIINEVLKNNNSCILMLRLQNTFAYTMREHVAYFA